MPMSYSPGRTNFGLLPEPEGRSIGFIASALVNLTILGAALLIGMTAKRVIERHYEMTALIVPTTPPPEIKVKQPPPPKLPPPPEQPKLQLQLQPKHSNRCPPSAPSLRPSVTAPIQPINQFHR